MLKDSNDVYGRVSQALHWVMAFYLIRQAVGVLAGYVNEAENVVSHFLEGKHQPTGVAILVLLLIRLAWVATQAGHRPRHPGTAGKFAVGGHLLLYILMLLVPVTGLLIAWGKGKGLQAYGLTLFKAGPEVEWAIALGRTLHTPVGWMLMVLIGGHIAIALYHHFVIHDRTMSRMLGNGRR